MLNKTAIVLKRFFPLTYLRYFNQKTKRLVKLKAYIPTEAYNLATINLDWLKASGIQGVILDLDNTIVSEDDRYLSPGAEAWIEQAKLQKFKVFILSNGKRRYRARAWAEHLDIPLINPAKKPFPFAFRKAIKHMQLQPKQVVVIGDSRHTDMLGAWLVGCPSIQVATLPHPFRWWEKLFGKRVQTPYPYGYKLWDNKLFYNK